MFSDFISFVQNLYNSTDFIPLHEPRFIGNEKKYLNECIDSTFVSSVGKFVDDFEVEMAKYTGAKYAIACVNGTAALHVSLKLAGVEQGDEVITQPLSFIATTNAINYAGAQPVFVDVSKETYGLSLEDLMKFFEEETHQKDGVCYNKRSNAKIKACVPMHTFGHPVEIEEIVALCEKHNVIVVEDAAESLGSYFKGKHTGTFGLLGTLSFNGNKTITSGGGGVILTNDETLAKQAKHLTTTAKVPHKWEYFHDVQGYNYRMPNINAALALAQLEQLDNFITNKRAVAREYETFLEDKSIQFLKERTDCKANYWLNAVLLKDRSERDAFLEATNTNGVMTRPVWELLYKLPMFKDCQVHSSVNAEWLADRLVNVPSSVRV